MISIYRQEVRPFTDKQVALVKNFAAQAVIAIENARLLNELRQRTTDLTERTAEFTEALEQQTATSDVLQVISSFPGNLEPVFASMLENAIRIWDATFGNIYRWDGEALHLMATHNTPAAFAEYRRRTPWRLSPTTVGRTIASKTGVHIADLAAEPAYTEQRDPGYVAAVELGGIRTLLVVPMMKEDELIGAFTVYRQEVCPFTDKQIALVQNFAAQAVIAIENARLLNELRQRTNDLSEALDQQTATSDVLQVTSSSPGDLEPVFTTMLEKAVRLCDAKFGTLYLPDDGRLRLVAAYDVPEFFAARRGVAFDPAPGGGLDEALRAKRPVQIPDLAATKSYIERSGRIGWHSHRLGRANAQGRSPHRHHRHTPSRSTSVHRQADRTRQEFRRSSRHRNRERAVAQRTAPAHSRPYGGIRPTDRDVRSPPSHQRISWRP
jgi:GAF domain-containing protein